MNACKSNSQNFLIFSEISVDRSARIMDQSLGNRESMRIVL